MVRNGYTVLFSYPNTFCDRFNWPELPGTYHDYANTPVLNRLPLRIHIGGLVVKTDLNLSYSCNKLNVCIKYNQPFHVMAYFNIV